MPYTSVTWALIYWVLLILRVSLNCALNYTSVSLRNFPSFSTKRCSGKDKEQLFPATTQPPLSKMGPKSPELLKAIWTGEFALSKHCRGACQLARQTSTNWHSFYTVRFSTLPSLQSSKALCGLQPSRAHLKHFWTCKAHPKHFWTRKAHPCFCARRIQLWWVATQPSNHCRLCGTGKGLHTKQ